MVYIKFLPGQDVLFPKNSIIILILHIFWLSIYSSYENSHFASCMLSINDLPDWICVTKHFSH